MYLKEDCPCDFDPIEIIRLKSKSQNNSGQGLDLNIHASKRDVDLDAIDFTLHWLRPEVKRPYQCMTCRKFFVEEEVRTYHEKSCHLTKYEM